MAIFSAYKIQFPYMYLIYVYAYNMYIICIK